MEKYDSLAHLRRTAAIRERIVGYGAARFMEFSPFQGLVMNYCENTRIIVLRLYRKTYEFNPLEDILYQDLVHYQNISEIRLPIANVKKIAEILISINKLDEIFDLEEFEKELRFIIPDFSFGIPFPNFAITESNIYENAISESLRHLPEDLQKEIWKFVPKVYPRLLHLYRKYLRLGCDPYDIGLIASRKENIILLVDDKRLSSLIAETEAWKWFNKKEFNFLAIRKLHIIYRFAKELKVLHEEFVW